MGTTSLLEELPSALSNNCLCGTTWSTWCTSPFLMWEHSFWQSTDTVQYSVFFCCCFFFSLSIDTSVVSFSACHRTISQNLLQAHELWHYLLQKASSHTHQTASGNPWMNARGLSVERRSNLAFDMHSSRAVHTVIYLGCGQPIVDTVSQCPIWLLRICMNSPGSTSNDNVTQ